MNSLNPKPRVLVSPLEWGLGHATRCIPIISALLSCKCEVFIAAEGATFALLKNEFPQVNFLPLAGYRIKFPENKSFFFLKMITQFPKIAAAIYRERRWLKKNIEKYKIEAVISDNRVGLYNKNITSVYITHQLLIKTGNAFTNAIAQAIHRYWINKFNVCWVPDFEQEGLAGELSHPASMPKNVNYIGALSRFDKKKKIEKKYDLLILISGPEPQRSIFENTLLANLIPFKGKALLVRGLPGDAGIIQPKNELLEIVNHLPAQLLCAAIQQSTLVISRSGYTTVMDLVKLTKSAILVPTPGQAEQQYLARYLMEKKIFFSLQQEGFNLSKALENFGMFKAEIPSFNMEQYKIVIKKFCVEVNPSGI